VAYQPKVGDFARYQLDQFPLPVVDTLLDCINELCDDPYRDLHFRVALVIPFYRIFPTAYLYGLWAIAYTVLDALDTVIIEAFRDTFY
jgi:hypothetical protein